MLLVVFLDQTTKFLALKFLSAHATLPLIPDVFHLTLVLNSGIAFGFFRSYQSVLLVLISLSLAALFFWGSRLKHEPAAATWGFGLILGGALGNWIDRVRVGAVIDFLDFRIWPVFNLADSAVTVGVCLYLLLLFRKNQSTS